MKKTPIAAVVVTMVLAMGQSAIPATAVISRTACTDTGQLEANLAPCTAWIASYSVGSPTSSHVIEAMTVSPDGETVFVTGTSYGGSTSNDIATIAYEAHSGSELWVARYDGLAHLADGARGIIASPDGMRVYVTGGTRTSNGWVPGIDILTIAYDGRTGEEIWTNVWNHIGHEWPATGGSPMAISPDGSRLYVAGETWNPPVQDWATLAYDTVDGTVLWTALHDGPGNSVDAPRGIALSPDGTRAFVTGIQRNPNDIGRDPTDGDDITTIAYDTATGVPVWNRTYAGTEPNSRDDPQSIGISPDGTRVFVTGLSQGIASPYQSYDVVTVAYDTEDGREAWTTRYDGPGSPDDRPRSLAVSPDGLSVAVTGSTGDLGTSVKDMLTIVYNAGNGDLRWVATYDTILSLSTTCGLDCGTDFITTKDVGNWVVFDPAGLKLFVIGVSARLLGRDTAMGTLAYDAAAGSLLWSAEYEDTGAEGLRAAVNPDGSLVYAGGFSGDGFLTIAYSTSDVHLAIPGPVDSLLPT